MRSSASLRSAALIFAVVVSAHARRASADTSASNKAAADALYDEAMRLAKSQKYEEAVPKLLASQRLDPGLGTLMNLGGCYEQLGKTASAWATYNEAVAFAKSSQDKQGRGERAAQAAKSLEPRLSKLVIAVPSASKLDGLEVRRDGELIDVAAWETPIPVDPGAHVIEAAAPAHAPYRTSIDVAAKPGTVTVTIPILTDAPVAAIGVGDAPTPWGRQRIGGVAAGGVGAAGVITGAIFGGLTIAKKSALAAHCLPSDPHKCDAQGVDIRAQGLTLANASNVAFAVGGVGLATGAALFFTAPAPKVARGAPAVVVRPMPVVAGETRGLWLQGEW
jgi:serine/threonine-protein kinase